MTTSIGRLVLDLAANAAEFEKDMQRIERSARRSSNKAARQFEAAGRAIARSMAVVGTAVAGVSAASVKLAVDAEETANKFRVVFRGSVEETDRALQRLTQTIPSTQTELRGFAAGVQDLLVPLGLARDEAARFSVQAVELAGDLASFNNVSVEEALNAIRSGLAGESEPLRRFGVDIRKTRLEALALSEGIIEVGESLEGADQAAAVFTALMRDSADAIGDAERTVDSAANQMRFLQADIKAVSEELGFALLPAFSELLRGLRGAEDGVMPLRDALVGMSRVLLQVAEFAIVAAGAFNELGVRIGQALAVAGRFAQNTRENFDFWDAVIPGRYIISGFDTFKDTIEDTGEISAAAAEDIQSIRDRIFALASPLRSAREQFSATADTLTEVNEGTEDAVRLNTDFLNAAREGVDVQTDYADATTETARAFRTAASDGDDWLQVLQDQVNIASEAQNAFLDVRDGLIEQITVLQGAGEGLRQYQRQLFITEQLSRLGENATAEFRAEIEKLSGALFDLEFPEEEIQRFTDTLSAEFGKGLQRGIENGINQIDAQDVLDGNFAEIGETLGRSVLTSVGAQLGSIGGPIGSAIGALIGDIIGEAIFGGGVPKFQIFGSQGQMDLGTDLTLDGPLGELNFAFREIESEAQVAVRNAFVQFDTTIAGFIRDTDQLTQIDQALQEFGVSSRSNGESIEGLLQLRFDAILSTFDQVTQSVVRAAGQTLEAQVQALADIQAIAVQEALGRGLGLDNALQIISDLQVPGEALAATFARLRDAAALLDTTMALTGATFGATREEVLRFGQGLADAFGGDLQRASSLLGTIFGTFFTESERLEAQVEQSTARAVDLLAQIGIDATDEILSRGGFRELFDSLSGVLSPEDLAILIEAGAEIAALIQAEEGLAEARGDVVDATNDAAEAAEEAAERQAELAELLRDVGREALSVIAPARAEYAELADSIEANIARARELGATERQLDFIRQASEIRIRGFIASLAESIASLTEQLFGAGPQIDAIGGTLNVAANAANNFRDQWLSAIDAIQDALDGQLLGPNSTLTAQERQQESVSQFFAALSAAQAGDLGAAQSLPQLFQQALAEGASFFGSTTGDFAALEAQLRSALENADLPVPPDSPDVQTAQNTLATSQAVQQVEQTALQQLTAATQLIDQIGLLADLTGQTPAEIGEEFGIPIAELIGILTGEVPDLTGDALAQYFDELVAETNEQLNELAQLETIGLTQVDLLIDIRDLLTSMDPPDGFAGPIPAFADGGPVQQTGLALVHSGEFVVPRDGTLVSGVQSSRESVAQEILAELRAGNNQREVLIGDQRRGLTAVASSSRDVRDELRKRTQTGKAALTRA